MSGNNLYNYFTSAGQGSGPNRGGSTGPTRGGGPNRGGPSGSSRPGSSDSNRPGSSDANRGGFGGSSRGGFGGQQRGGLAGNPRRSHRPSNPPQVGDQTSAIFQPEWLPSALDRSSSAAYQYAADPSSGPWGSSDPAAYDDVETVDEARAEQMKTYLSSGTFQAMTECRLILNKLPVGPMEGWCKPTTLQPSAGGKYAQVSYQGCNKIAILQHVVLWADGLDVINDQHASHLCNNRLCTTRHHVIPESPEQNNARKGCRVWVDCPHCPKKILVCLHNPPCIKYAQGFDDMAHLIANGVCARV